MMANMSPYVHFAIFFKLYNLYIDLFLLDINLRI